MPARILLSLSQRCTDEQQQLLACTSHFLSLYPSVHGPMLPAASTSPRGETTTLFGTHIFTRTWWTRLAAFGSGPDLIICGIPLGTGGFPVTTLAAALGLV